MERTTYHKMKMTGPRSAVMAISDAPTKPVANAIAQVTKDTVAALSNPTVKAIADTQKQMAAAVAGGLQSAKATKRKLTSHARGGVTVTTTTKKKRIGPSTALAIYDTCLQRLRALKSQFDQSYDPLVRLLAQQRQVADQPTAAAMAAAAAAPTAPGTVGAATLLNRVLDALPKQYHNKYKALSQYLVESPNLIRVTASGQPVIGGKELAGQKFVDAMRSLYVWHKREDISDTAKGIIRVLHSVGVPGSMLSSAAAKDTYRYIQEKQAAEEEFQSAGEDEPDDGGEDVDAGGDQPTFSGYVQKAKGLPAASAIKWPGKLPEVLRVYKY
jgi:hypothetical protein